MYCVFYLTFVLLVINCFTSLDWRTLSGLVIYVCMLCELTQRITTGVIPQEASVSGNRRGLTSTSGNDVIVLTQCYSKVIDFDVSHVGTKWHSSKKVGCITIGFTGRSIVIMATENIFKTEVIFN